MGKEVKFFLLLIFMTPWAFLWAQSPEGQKSGDEDCAMCHEEAAASFGSSLHKTVFKDGFEFQCESCHGPGQMHIDEEDPSKILGPENNLAKMESACLACHGQADHGVKGDHVRAHGVSCTQCHRIHQPSFKGHLVKAELALCTDCHQDVQAKMHLRSHHPVREGKMQCSSCHPFDGSQPILAGVSNETCLNCHAQYRGPFVFEHAPVLEDCRICHDPHGAVADNLLKQNEPFLCLQCHQMHFHAELAGYEGDFVTPNNGRPGSSDLTATKRTMLTKCTRCHSQVHGSDYPSQSISGQGRSLTR